MSSAAGQKRKVYYGPQDNGRSRKRQKSKDARDIPVQTADAALSTTGELNIASFVKAREFEIDALDKSMQKSRKGLMSRAFQQVPRHMRRRTASHNVKKVPRRLRARAAQEMKEDNTPTVNSATRKPSAKLRLRLETAKALKKLNTGQKTVRQKKKEAKTNAEEPDPAKHLLNSRVPKLKKNKLAIPPTATSKYKRRQVTKTWLPTHLWHTKRAHMTSPTLPLWRMALPLSPTEKSYRSSHRAADIRGCIAWDASYMSTVCCWGTEPAILGLLKSLSFHGEGWSGSKYNRWRSGQRFAEGWIKERDNLQKPIASVLVFWQCQSVRSLDGDTSTADVMNVNGPASGTAKSVKPRKKPKLDSKILIRIHPSAFHKFWLELLKVSKTQKPQVLVEDLRFDIGSIIIEGPGSTEALVGVLKPAASASTPTSQWTQLAGISNPASLPQNPILALEVVDPRLHHSPKQITVHRGPEAVNSLNELIVSWPFASTVTDAKLFHRNARYSASKGLQSQKAINRRKQTPLPGHDIPQSADDVAIPVMLLAHRSQGSQLNGHGSWTVLLPWSCVDPVWRSLMYYPLSSGTTPRFGGLRQNQDLAFEKSQPWFPGDFPGTEAGKAWDRTESERRFDAWVARPPSRRYAWDQLDLGLGRKGEIGRGWACDWEYLLRGPGTTPRLKKKEQDLEKAVMLNPSSQLRTQRQRKEAARSAYLKKEAEARRRNSSSPKSDAENANIHNDVQFGQLTPAEAKSVLSSGNQSTLPREPVVATIRIRLLTRGTPKPAARVYRLPLPTTTRQDTISQPTGDDSMSETAGPALFSTIFHPLPQRTLRDRWLALDPNPSCQVSNTNSITEIPGPAKSEKQSRHGDARVPRVYSGRADLSHIRVFPKDAPEKVLNMFGPRPAQKTREELLTELIPQVAGPKVDDDQWKVHIPCPEERDLIGFVTSGAYNLVEGAGTAIGAVWVQRVLQGWQDDTSLTENRKDADGEKERNGPQTKLQRQRVKTVDRERHLCIVRNAGESVGRLGLWEVC